MESAKNLDELLQNISFQHTGGPAPDVTAIRAVHSDSRRVENGSLFIAVPGLHVDGHDFLEKAVEAGAAALVVGKGAVADFKTFPENICVVAVESTPDALIEIAGAFYGYPHRAMRFIGITGTNGKTTISYLLEKILTDQKRQTGVIGTVNYRYQDSDGVLQQVDASHTTPDPLPLIQILARMRDAGVDTVVMEVSSHALAQKRVGDIRFDVAIFTNLTHDHLDYHRSMEDYFAVKARLFLEYLKSDGVAVVVHKEGSGEDWAGRLLEMVRQRGVCTLPVGEGDDALFTLKSCNCGLEKTTVTCCCDGREESFASSLIGRFNVDNILAAAGGAYAAGLDLKKIIRSLPAAKGAPGRLERVELRGERFGAALFVDYAHTPDALLNVLTTLKDVPHRRLICLFGCGGDRDTAKRPEMAEIAARLADIAIVTDDNPRTEDPKSIREQIVCGIDTAICPRVEEHEIVEGAVRKGFTVIGDRRQAIAFAVRIAQERDIVLVAGKGHEKYQITRGGKHFFDDVLAVQEAMLSWRISSVAQALGVSSPECEEYAFTGVSTDTRTITYGSLFVALKGENFDGHAFLDEAVKNGAKGLVVSALPEKNFPGVAIFRVDDTLKALGTLAGYRRRRIASISVPKVAAITGSCGKTSVKEMLSAIFRQNWPESATTPSCRVLKTEGNLNNLVGLPLSLLPLQLKHRAAVLEMGMNHLGEIAQMAKAADPDICCITNVCGVHLEGLGTIENVGRAKEELFRHSRDTAAVIINLDDPYLRECRLRYAGRPLVCFSADPDNLPAECAGKADLWASDVTVAEDGRASFLLHVKKCSCRIALPVPGVHMVANALAAAASAHAAGVGIETIAAGLAAFVLPGNRLDIKTDARGITVINDTYNANPASMEAGLKMLRSMVASARVAILGDMFELGKSGVEVHQQVGKIAAEQGIDYLLVYGELAGYIARGARQAGMSDLAILELQAKEEAAPRIDRLYTEGCLGVNPKVLVKASRGMRFETIVADIIGETAPHSE